MNTNHELGSFDLNFETGEGYWSPEFTGMFGLPENHRGDFQEVLKRIHPDDRRAVAVLRHKPFRSEATYHDRLEVRVPGPDGNSRRFQLMACLFGHDSQFGLPECVLGFVADITERRKSHFPAEKDGRADWEGEVATLRFGAFNTNFETGEESLSPELAAIFGLPAEAKGGFEVVFKHVHPDDRPTFISACLYAFGPGFPRLSVKYRIIREDGTVRWVQMAGCTIFHPEAPRRAVCFAGVAADITEEEETANED